MADKLENEDFLEVDREIPGQRYVCLSFISPENVLKRKELFYLHHYLRENSTKYNLSLESLEDDYDNYIYRSKENLDKEFDEENEFQTSSRGVKIRGVYSTFREADIRAKVLQRMDKSFHVFVGQVGYWLPWDPEADKIEKQEFGDAELNKLMKAYQKNKTNCDIHYMEETTRRMELATKDGEMDSTKTIEAEAVEVVAEIDSGLDLVDPWMARKVEETETLKEI